MMLTRMRLWLRTVFMRARFEREMQEEMAAHLAQATERLQARGLTARAARSAARREFGNVDLLQGRRVMRAARAGSSPSWLMSGSGFAILGAHRFPL